MLLPQRQAWNQWGSGSRGWSSRVGAVKSSTTQASCSPLAMVLSPTTHPSSNCLMKIAGLSPFASGTVSRGSLPLLSSNPLGHSSGLPSMSHICCLRVLHLALTSVRCCLKWLALLLYTSSLWCRVVARPMMSANSWAGVRFSCPVRMFWTMQGERGLSQKALVSRSWKGLGLGIWLEGMGLGCKAESTSWSVMMTDSDLR